MAKTTEPRDPNAKPAVTQLLTAEQGQELQAELDRLQRQIDHKDRLLDEKNTRIAELESETSRLRTRLDEVTSIQHQLAAGGTRSMVLRAEGHLTRDEFQELATENPAREFIVLEDFHSPSGKIPKHTKVEARQFPDLAWWIDGGLRLAPVELPPPKAAKAEDGKAEKAA